MPALKARSPIVAMERSPLSEAQTARLLAAECHRLKSEYSSAGYEYDVLKKIQAAEGRVLAISEGRDPDSRSDFLKVPYARTRYLSDKAGEMARKMYDLHQEITRSPLPQLSVLGGPRRSCSGPSCRAGPSPHGSRGALRPVSPADRADPAASAARNISCAGVVYVRL